MAAARAAPMARRAGERWQRRQEDGSEHRSPRRRGGSDTGGRPPPPERRRGPSGGDAIKWRRDEVAAARAAPMVRHAGERWQRRQEDGSDHWSPRRRSGSDAAGRRLAVAAPAAAAHASGGDVREWRRDEVAAAQVAPMARRAGKRQQRQRQRQRRPRRWQRSRRRRWERCAFTVCVAARAAVHGTTRRESGDVSGVAV
eukprot:1782041-Prymnesium_polylepis.1